MFFLFSNFLINYPAVSHRFIHGLTSNIFATNTQEIGIVTQIIFIPYVSVSVFTWQCMRDEVMSTIRIEGPLTLDSRDVFLARYCF